MPKAQQNPQDDTPIILTDLLALTQSALAPVQTILETATLHLRSLVSKGGRVSGQLVEEHQTATHGLAWLATYSQSLEQMQKWAEGLIKVDKFGEIEQLILQITFGEYLWQIYGGIQMNQGEILRLQDLGLAQNDMRGMIEPAVQTLTQNGNTQAARIGYFDAGAISKCNRWCDRS